MRAIRCLAMLDFFLRHRLPEDTPDWLREDLEAAIFRGRTRGYRLAEPEDLTPLKPIIVVSFREGQGTKYKLESGSRGQIRRSPLSRNGGTLYANWWCNGATATTPVEEFLLTGEHCPPGDKSREFQVIFVRDDPVEGAIAA